MDELSDTNTLSSSNFEEVGNNPKMIIETSNTRNNEFVSKKRPRNKQNHKKKYKSNKKYCFNNESQYLKDKNNYNNKE